MLCKCVVLLLIGVPSVLLAQSQEDKCLSVDAPCEIESAADRLEDVVPIVKSAETNEPGTAFRIDRPLPRLPESDQISFSVARPPAEIKERFHWKPALAQSMEFLAIQHSFRMATSYWARYEMQGPFIKDWLRTVSGVRFTKWDDGDPFLCNYIGHPIQGSVTGFIQIQNDPRGRALKIGKSKEYWHSRLRATAWAAAYSAQFEIGPLSEASLGNLGSYEYATDSGKLTNGTGLVDFVVTPVMGLGWMLIEDTMDRFVSDKLERKYNNFGTRVIRGALNPSRTLSNLLRMKKPWYRDREHGREVGD